MKIKSFRAKLKVAGIVENKKETIHCYERVNFKISFQSTPTTALKNNQS